MRKRFCVRDFAMSLIDLDGYTRETGLAGKSLGQFGVEIVNADKPSLPVSSEVILESLQMTFRSAFTESVLDRFGCALFRAEHSSQLHDEMQVLDRPNSGPFLHRHVDGLTGELIRQVAISSASVFPGKVPTVFIPGQELARILSDLSKQTSFSEAEQRALGTVTRTPSYAASIEITRVINKLIFPKRDEEFYKKILSPDNSYIHTWGENEVVVCDNKSVYHGTFGVPSVGARLRGTDLF